MSLGTVLKAAYKATKSDSARSAVSRASRGRNAVPKRPQARDTSLEDASRREFLRSSADQAGKAAARTSLGYQSRRAVKAAAALPAASKESLGTAAVSAEVANLAADDEVQAPSDAVRHVGSSLDPYVGDP